MINVTDEKFIKSVASVAKSLVQSNVEDWRHYKVRIIPMLPLARMGVAMEFRVDDGEKSRVEVDYRVEVWDAFMRTHDFSEACAATAFELLYRFASWYGSDPYEGTVEGIEARRFVGEEYACHKIRTKVYRALGAEFPEIRLADIDYRILDREDPGFLKICGDGSPGEILTTLTLDPFSEDRPFRTPASIDADTRAGDEKGIESHVREEIAMLVREIHGSRRTPGRRGR